MKLLVTGGAGFIGSNLVEKLLEDNHEVVVIDNFNDTYDPNQKRDNIKIFLNNKKVKLYEIDLINKKNVEKVFKKEKYFDFVFHLAGIGGVRPSQLNPNFYYEDNVITTINLAETMKKHDCKNLIYYSSSSVYGNINKNKFSESDVADTPVSVYAATKKSSEVLLYNYFINYNFKIVILRPFTVFGPRQRPDLAIHLFSKKIMNDEEITIYGDGSMLRDYTYVSDIVDATIKATDYLNNNDKVYEIFNVASSNPKTINEMVTTIEKVLNKKAKIKYEDKPIGDVNKTFGNIIKAKKLLNWKPSVSFEDGIRSFIDWYKDNEK
ncbi:MAG: GDP-mannose 4,6-dehydratase [Bacilli bacterium]|nr:GDP-mannose 4,6-dehydratase [Bacilli bacterium]